MHAAALTLHIGAGSFAILSGGASLALRKGGPLHRRLGTLFFLSMLLMTAMAALLAAVDAQRGNLISAGFVCYLVVTARMAIRRKPGQVGPFEHGAALAALALAAFAWLSGFQALASPRGSLEGYPSTLYFVLGSLVALAALLDLNLILRGGVSGRQLIARHVWRMCTALFFATGSFFIGQQKVMPVFLHGSPVLLALGLAPLPAMIFWLVRIRRSVGPARPGKVTPLTESCYGLDEAAAAPGSVAGGPARGEVAVELGGGR